MEARGKGSYSEFEYEFEQEKEKEKAKEQENKNVNENGKDRVKNVEKCTDKDKLSDNTVLYFTNNNNSLLNLFRGIFFQKKAAIL